MRGLFPPKVAFAGGAFQKRSVMLQFPFMGFPVRVHWTFWLLSFFIGGGFYARSPEAYGNVLIAMAIIFVSILVHELGHALAGRRFGARPEIELMAFGGLCSLPGAAFNRGQSILVSFAGPAAGFLLALVFVFLAFALDTGDPVVRHAVWIGLFVNIVWNVLNLLPILPLDGGQIFRDLAGPKRFELVRWTGAATAGLLAVFALANQFFIGAAIAGALAYFNFQGSTRVGGGWTKPGSNP